MCLDFDYKVGTYHSEWQSFESRNDAWFVRTVINRISGALAETYSVFAVFDCGGPMCDSHTVKIFLIGKLVEENEPAELIHDTFVKSP